MWMTKAEWDDVLPWILRSYNARRIKCRVSPNYLLFGKECRMLDLCMIDSGDDDRPKDDWACTIEVVAIEAEGEKRDVKYENGDRSAVTY